MKVSEASVPLRLADGQLLLRKTGAEGALQLGVVRGGRLRLVLTGFDAEVDLDSCSQVVLPWRPPFGESWAATLVTKLAELKRNVEDLKKEVKPLSVQKASTAEMHAPSASASDVSAPARETMERRGEQLL